MAILILAVTGIFLMATGSIRPKQPEPPRFSVFSEPEPYKEPEAVCGCTHHYCFHDKDGCGHTSQVRTFDTFRFEYYKNARCECKRYTGPEPLPQVIP